MPYGKSKIQVAIYLFLTALFLFLIIGYLANPKTTATDYKHLLLYLFCYFSPPLAIIVLLRFSIRSIKMTDPNDIKISNIEEIIRIQTAELEGFTSYLSKISYFFIDSLNFDVVLAHLFFPWALMLILLSISELKFFIGFIVLACLSVLCIVSSIGLIYITIKRRYEISFKKCFIYSLPYSFLNMSIILFWGPTLFKFFSYIIENISTFSFKEILNSSLSVEFGISNSILVGIYVALIGLSFSFLILSHKKIIQYSRKDEELKNKYLKIIKRKYTKFKDRYNENFLSFLATLSMKKDEDAEYYRLRDSLKIIFIIEKLLALIKPCSISAMIFFAILFFIEMFSLEILGNTAINLILMFNMFFWGISLVSVILFCHFEQKLYKM